MSKEINMLEATLDSYLQDKKVYELNSMVQEIEKKISELTQDSELKAWDHVELARHKDRPTSLDLIKAVFPDFIEFHGDRNYRDDEAIIGGIASFNGIPVTVIGQQKGKTTEENIKRNFGMPHPEGYRKALRLMKQAEKFNRPIINFIDTPGAYPGLGAEERGQGEAIATNLLEMSKLKVPVMAIIVAEGGSGGALAMAVANEVHMLEHSIYSILSPEGFASILWKDATRNKEAAEIMKLTAKDLLNFKIIDGVINEPINGAHTYLSITAYRIGVAIERFMEDYNDRSASYIIKQRYNKFREMGVYRRMSNLL